ncbi:helix-turn-helix domain-containing protein [Lonepinella sp. MS14436]|uniref:helix-turn-helix domain-containing protein n=1 Tax=Lonepinella sp. MS14436 TaxID=3003619 RepID=UPI0036D77292
MSSKLLGHVWDLDLPDSTTKLILLRLADNANDETGECFPSLAYLQDKCSIKSKTTIRLALTKLQELGFILVIKRKKESGINTSNLYKLNMEKILTKTKITKNSSVKSSGSETVPYGSETVPLDGSESVPRTNNSFEPIINQSVNNPPLPPKGESANAEHESQPLVENKSLPKNKNLSVDYTEIMNEFNDCVEDTPISQVRVLSDKRKRQIYSLAKLLKQEFGTCDVKTFRNYFDDFLRQVSARKDRFYFGGGKTGWVANFDYLMRAETFTKTLEDSL